MLCLTVAPSPIAQARAQRPECVGMTYNDDQDREPVAKDGRDRFEVVHGSGLLSEVALLGKGPTGSLQTRHSAGRCLTDLHEFS